MQNIILFIIVFLALIEAGFNPNGEAFKTAGIAFKASFPILAIFQIGMGVSADSPQKIER
jgi:hypothetical protein